MKFEAKRIDLDLELVTLDGTEVTIQPTVSLDAKSLISIVKSWAKKEEVAEIAEDDAEVTAFDRLANQLHDIYGDVEQDWWLENLDTRTIQDIMLHVGQTIAGVKKSEVNSS